MLKFEILKSIWTWGRQSHNRSFIVNTRTLNRKFWIHTLMLVIRLRQFDLYIQCKHMILNSGHPLFPSLKYPKKFELWKEFIYYVWAFITYVVHIIFIIFAGHCFCQLRVYNHKSNQNINFYFLHKWILGNFLFPSHI